MRHVAASHDGHVGASCGPAGYAWIENGTVRRVPAPKVDVVDTVGAGDSFGGGFLATWVDAGLGRDDLGDLDAVSRATQRAIVVAGITCTRAGAEPPRLADLTSTGTAP